MYVRRVGLNHRDPVTAQAPIVTAAEAIWHLIYKGSDRASGIAKTALSLSTWTAPQCICTEPTTLKPYLFANLQFREKKNLRCQMIYLWLLVFFTQLQKLSDLQNDPGKNRETNPQGKQD